MIQYEKFFKSLGDRNRLRIVNLLSKGSWRVSDIAYELDIEENLASHHLRTMYKAGIAKSSKKGREVYYEINYVKTKAVFKALCKKQIFKDIFQEISREK
jgi:ArsR family transcriptional regulator